MIEGRTKIKFFPQTFTGYPTYYHFGLRNNANNALIANGRLFHLYQRDITGNNNYELFLASINLELWGERVVWTPSFIPGNRACALTADPDGHVYIGYNKAAGIGEQDKLYISKIEATTGKLEGSIMTPAAGLNGLYIPPGWNSMPEGFNCMYVNMWGWGSGSGIIQFNLDSFSWEDIVLNEVNAWIVAADDTFAYVIQMTWGGDETGLYEVRKYRRDDWSLEATLAKIDGHAWPTGQLVHDGYLYISDQETCGWVTDWNGTPRICRVDLTTMAWDPWSIDEYCSPILTIEEGGTEYLWCCHAGNYSVTGDSDDYVVDAVCKLVLDTGDEVERVYFEQREQSLEVVSHGLTTFMCPFETFSNVLLVEETVGTEVRQKVYVVTLYGCAYNYTLAEAYHIREFRLYQSPDNPPPPNPFKAAASGEEIEQVATELRKDAIIGALEEVGMTATEIFEDLLNNYYSGSDIVLGGVDPELDVTITIRFENMTVMDCIYELPKVLGGYVSVRPKPTDPMVRELWFEVSPGEDKGQELRLGKNLTGIIRTRKYSDLVTRLVPLGYGEGNEQLTVAMVEPRVDETATIYGVPDATHGFIKLGGQFSCYNGWTAEGDALPAHVTVKKGVLSITASCDQGKDARIIRVDLAQYDPEDDYTVCYEHALYLIADTVDTYGMVTRPLNCKTSIDGETMLAEGRTYLMVCQYPSVAYKVTMIDLSVLPGMDWESLKLCSSVKTIDEVLGIEVKECVVQIDRKSLRDMQRLGVKLDSWKASVVDTVLDHERRLQALERRECSGTSYIETYDRTMTIGPSGYTPKEGRTLYWYLSEHLVRCNAVVLNWVQIAIVGGDSCLFDVWIDGSLQFEDVASADNVDITKFLTRDVDGSLCGLWHEVEFRNQDLADATCVSAKVDCQVFRRIVPIVGGA